MATEQAIVIAPSEIVRRERPELALSPEQEQLIRDSFANGASDQEFQVLMQVARARRLNPFLRQIHFVKRWNSQLRREVWSAQAAVDGLRSIAEDSGKYAGQDEPEFEYDAEAKSKTNPKGIRLCRVKVYRKDWPRPCVGVAHWEEYFQTNKEGALTQFWRDKPHIMLSKCAESLALRKAFPEELAGLYAPEEMGQDPVEEAPQLPPRKPGSGKPVAPMNISPHLNADEQPGDFNPNEDGDRFHSSALETLSSIEEQIKECADVEGAEAARKRLGSVSAPGQLMREINAARGVLGGPSIIGAEQYKELCRVWHKLNRMLERVERDLDPGSAADFLNPRHPDPGAYETAGHDEVGKPL